MRETIGARKGPVGCPFLAGKTVPGRHQLSFLEEYSLLHLKGELMGSPSLFDCQQYLFIRMLRCENAVKRDFIYSFPLYVTSISITILDSDQLPMMSFPQ
jgi:hypothetical protein